MNALAGGMGGAKKALAEKAIETVENQFGTLLPMPLPLLNPCCGGPMGTLKAFEFVVPADKKDDFKSGYEKYQDAKKQLAEM